MTRSIFLAAALASGLALAGCEGRQAHDSAAASEAADTAAADAIRAQETQWNRDFASKNLERLVGHYAADAYVATPSAASASGTDAIRAAYVAMLADPNLRIEFEADRVEVSGDLAYSRGHYGLQATNPETRQPMQERGSYPTVWRRQEDGSWKAVEDFLTPGPAAESAAATPAAG